MNENLIPPWLFDIYHLDTNKLEDIFDKEELKDPIINIQYRIDNIKKRIKYDINDNLYYKNLISELYILKENIEEKIYNSAERYYINLIDDIDNNTHNIRDLFIQLQYLKEIIEIYDSDKDRLNTLVERMNRNMEEINKNIFNKKYIFKKLVNKIDNAKLNIKLMEKDINQL